MIADPSIGWQMFIVAAWTVASAFIVLAVVIIGPTLWRQARAHVLEWLATPRAEVVDIETRRRDLKAASVARR